MKKKSINNEFPPTGVALLSGRKLAPYLAEWEEMGRKLHGLYMDMIRVPGGQAITGTRLKKIAEEGKCVVVSDKTKYALVMALRLLHPLIVWDDISEDFEI